MRRIRADEEALQARRRGRARQRRLRLGRADRAMYDALEQLRQGIPLNWSQVEDDPELIALAQIATSPDVTEWRGLPTPGALQQDLFEALAPRLPRPKPKPVKVTPKTMAGFSERVLVPTQVEDEVPSLTSTTLPWVLATVAAALVLGVGAWFLSGALGLRATQTYTWLQLRQDGGIVTQVKRPAGWTPLSCRRQNTQDPSLHRGFDASLLDRTQAQLKVGFPINFLPATLPVTPTTGFRLRDVALSPCTGDSPDPTDPGMIVKLTYTARKQIDANVWTASSLVVYQGRSVPFTVDVERGKWKEVNPSGARGFYWSGGPYVDLEGTQWIGNASVLAVESDNVVTVYVGQADQGVDESMLTGLAGYIQAATHPAANRPLPAFNLIELRKGTEVVSAAPTPVSWRLPACLAAPNANYKREHTYYHVADFKQAQAYTGFPIYGLPPTGEVPDPFTLSVIDGSVRPCTGNAFASADPGAAAQLRYRLLQNIKGKATASEVVLFQWRFLPAVVDISKGTWKEVQLANGHGILWTGVPYSDPEGSEWSREVNVLVFENDDYVFTLIGHANENVSGDVLIALASGLSR